MAPKQKKSKTSSSQAPVQPIDTQIKQWLMDPLDNKIDRLDSKLDKRFNKLKSFFGTIWEAISCASTSATLAQDPGKRPMPPTFTWSSSEEGTCSGTSNVRGRGQCDSEEKDDEEEGDTEEEGDKEEEGDTTESNSQSH